MQECQARSAAVAYAERAADKKIPQRCVAASLNVSSRTLRHWKSGQVEVCRRGRPPAACSIESRNEVIRFLHHVTGPAVGLPALRALFPKMPRVILEDLLRRYRRVWRRRYRVTGFQLTWHHAGTVWAMDFSEALQPVDAIYPYIFAVRDLASHQQLAWEPVVDEKAETVIPILSRLFAEHGRPLVLKSDNGSAFIAEMTQASMLEAVVSQLFSPARRPQYNGALERSNSTNKIYTQQHAAFEGHPYRWTSEDLEHARQLANTISRPSGPTGPTPEEAWHQRSPITDDQRQAFQQTLGKARIKAASDLGLDLEDDLSVADRARLDRLALSRTLEELGYLTKKQVRRPPKKPKRLLREKLARRVRKHRDDQDSKTANDAPESLPSLHPSATSRALVSSPGGATAMPSADAQAARAQSATRKTLASAHKNVTMQPVACADLPPPARDKPRATPTPAHREQAIPSWLRRPITLLASIAKAAKIS
jgi:putative transposase